MDETFAEHEVAHGGRLSVRITGSMLDEVMDDIRTLNPHLSEKALSTLSKRQKRWNEDTWDGGPTMDPSDGRTVLHGNLGLHFLGLRHIPESLCRLKINGYLGLQRNDLQALPDNFGVCCSVL